MKIYDKDAIFYSLVILMVIFMIFMMCSCECIPEKGRDNSFIKGHERPDTPELRTKIQVKVRDRR
jgi:hypothetical protein